MTSVSTPPSRSRLCRRQHNVDEQGIAAEQSSRLRIRGAVHMDPYAVDRDGPQPGSFRWQELEGQTPRPGSGGDHVLKDSGVVFPVLVRVPGSESMIGEQRIAPGGDDVRDGSLHAHATDRRSSRIRHDSGYPSAGPSSIRFMNQRTADAEQRREALQHVGSHPVIPGRHTFSLPCKRRTYAFESSSTPTPTWPRRSRQSA